MLRRSFGEKFPSGPFSALGGTKYSPMREVSGDVGVVGWGDGEDDDGAGFGRAAFFAEAAADADVFAHNHFSGDRADGDGGEISLVVGLDGADVEAERAIFAVVADAGVVVDFGGADFDGAAVDEFECAGGADVHAGEFVANHARLFLGDDVGEAVGAEAVEVEFDGVGGAGFDAFSAARTDRFELAGGHGAGRAEVALVGFLFFLGSGTVRDCG